MKVHRCVSKVRTQVVVIIFTVVAMMGLAGTHVMADTDWQNSGSTWSTAGNWSIGAPAPGTNAFLPSAASRVNPSLTADTLSFGILNIDNTQGNYDITGAYRILASGISITGGGATTITGCNGLPCVLTVGAATLTMNKILAYGGTGGTTLQISTSGGGLIHLAGGIQVWGNSGAARTMTLAGNGTVFLRDVFSGFSGANKFLTTGFSGALEIYGINGVYGGWEHRGGSIIMNGRSTGSESTIINGVTTTNAGLCGVYSGAYLGGTGSLNDVILRRASPTGSPGGIFRPGDQMSGSTIGVFTVNGDFQMECGSSAVSGGPYTAANRAKSAGTLEFDINGLNAYDQLVCMGSVNPTSSPTSYGNGRVILNINSDFLYDAATPSSFIKLIDKQSAGDIASTFWNSAAANIPEGSSFVFTNSFSNTNGFEFTYVGGDGNDFGVLVTGLPMGGGTIFFVQ